MSDRDLMSLIPFKRYELPAVIARKAGAKRVNAQLGRLFKSGMIERVLGAHCYLYRSRQVGLV